MVRGNTLQLQARPVTAKSLRVPGGTDATSVQLVTGGLSESDAAVQAVAARRGIDFQYFVGDNLSVNGKADTRGVVWTDGQGVTHILARADHPAFTGTQLGFHEMYHDAISREAHSKGGTREWVVESRYKAMKSYFRDNFVDSYMLERYKALYEGSGLGEVDIKEELLCDMAGGINEFARVEGLMDIPELRIGIQSVMKARVQEFKNDLAKEMTGESANETRGPSQVFESRDAGVVKYSSESNISKSIKKQIEAAEKKLSSMEVVASVSTDDVPNTDLGNMAKIYSRRINKTVDRQGYGIIETGQKQLNKALNYQHSKEDKAAILAIERVLKRGIVIDEHTDHKKKGNVDSITFGAPIKIDGIRYNMGAVVQTDKSNVHRFKTYRILLPSGAVIEIVDKKEEATTARSPLTDVSGGNAITSSSEDNISQPAPNSNPESDMKQSRDITHDSDGRQLTPAQQEFFKDSKVMDEDGNLLKVYHGTSEAFNTFDMGKGRANMDIQGSFFSPWEIDAGGYGENVRAFYLNITNPAPEDVAYSALNKFKGQNNAGIKAREYLEGLGYDGVNNGGEEYIAFRPEQIKLVDNENPTDNPDIRFSRDSEGKKLTNAQIDYFRDSKVVDKNGNLLKVYHGTSESFNTFERSQIGTNFNTSLEGDGFFFTNSKASAEAYGKNVKECYLKITSPLVINGLQDSDYFYNAADIFDYHAASIGERWREGDYDGIIVRHKNSDLYIVPQSQQAKLTSNENPTDNPDVRFSRDLSFSQQVDDVLTGKHNPRHDLYVAETPEYLKDLNFMSGPVLMRNSKVQEIIDKHPEMDVELIKNIPEIVEDPVLALKSKTHPEESVVLIGDLTTAKGNVIVPIWVNQEGVYINLELEETHDNTNFVASAYGRETKRLIEYAVENEGVVYQSPDKKRVEQLLTRDGLQLPTPLTVSDSVIKIAHEAEDSNKKSRDIANKVMLPDDLQQLADAYKDLESQYKELQAENKKNAERYQHFKGETRLNVYSANPKVSEAEVQKTASSYIKDYNLDMEADELAGKIKKYAEEFKAGRRSFAELSEDVLPIANEMARSATVLVNGPEQEIVERIRTTEIQISDKIKADIPDYNEWRKSYFGRARVSSQKGLPVEDFYKDLQESYGTTLFPEEVGNPTDQLMLIMDMMDTLAPQRAEKMFATFELAEATQSIAFDLMQDVMGMNVPKTFADKQKEARMNLKKQMQKKANDALKAARVDRDNKLKALKEHHREMAEKKRIRKEEATDRQKLLKVSRRLKKMKTTKANRALIEQMIGDLDTVAVNLTGSKEFTKSGDQAKPGMKQRLEALRSWYNEQLDDKDFLRKTGIEDAIARLEQKQIADMDIDDVRELTNIMLAFEHRVRTENKMIRDEDKRDIFLMGQEVIDDIASSRGTKMEGLDNLFVGRTLSPERAIRRMTDYWDNDPLYLKTKALSKGQRDMIDYQNKANRLFDRWTSDRKSLDHMTGRHKSDWFEIAGMFDNKPVKAMITPAMRMSLYLAAKNDDNMRHIQEGGVRIPDMDLYMKGKIEDAYAKGTLVQLKRSQINKISEQMSKEEIAAADAMRAYYNGMSQNAINEVSEELYGYSLAEVENYFPINTDPAFTKSNDELSSFIAEATIDGMGMLKTRMQANNPVMLVDAFGALTKSVNDAAKFVGLAIPVRNFKKLMNVQVMSFDENGETTGYKNSVENIIENRWGKTGLQYINNMLSDIEGNARKERGRFNQNLNKLRSNYAGAVLTLNLSVAMKQAASYPTAASVLGWKPLIKAFGNTRLSGKMDLDLISKYTPLLYYRMQGYSTTELGDIAQSNNWFNRQVASKKWLNWIQAIDIATTKKLWKASEYYVRDNFKNLENGTDDYYRQVAEIYNQVIEETQPNYTTMQRPDWLREDNALLQSMMMFKTQPFQNFNIVYDSIGNYLAKRRHYNAISGAKAIKNYSLPNSRQALTDAEVDQAKAQVKLAHSKMAHSLSAILVSSLVFAAMTFAYGWFSGNKKKYKDKETDKQTLGSTLEGFGKDVGASLFGSMPFGDDIWELVASEVFGDQYYGMSSTTLTALTDFISATKKGFDTVVDATGIKDDKEKPPVRNAAYWQDFRLEMGDVLKKWSKTAGIPYENVEKIFNGFFSKMIKVKGEYIGQYEYLKLTTSLTKSYVRSDYYDNLYEAYKNDKSQFKDIYEDMLSLGFKDTTIKSNMENRMKKEAGVSSVNDLEERFEPYPERSNKNESKSKSKASSSTSKKSTTAKTTSAPQTTQTPVTQSMQPQTVDTSDSSMISGAQYNPGSQELSITFRSSGRTYTYKNVSQETWIGFQSAPSKGNYFNNYIK